MPPRAGESRPAGSAKRRRTEKGVKGCEGYPKPFRELAVTLLAHGQQQHLPCHPSTVYRWRGDISRKAKTGGQKAWVLRGEHELLLCFYRMVYPKAQAAEIIAFIARESSDGALFTPSQVSRREKELGYTRKRGSTLENQALTPANIRTGGWRRQTACSCQFRT